MKPIRILVLNGPNLNLTGRREQQHYGTRPLTDLPGMLKELHDTWPELETPIFQSNYEGEIIDKIQSAPAEHIHGIVINPGGFTHSSVSVADALRASGLPAVEVHLSHVNAREDFRRHNVIAPACIATVSGMGLEGYILAIRYLTGKTAGR